MSTHPFGVVASPGKLHVAGEVDLAVAARLLDSILSAGLAGDSATLAVDLSDVTFLDSTGIGALIEARNRLAGLEVQLIVENPTANIRRVLEMSGTADHLGLAMVAAAD